jgi:hypothetical protein
MGIKYEHSEKPEQGTVGGIKYDPTLEEEFAPPAPQVQEMPVLDPASGAATGMTEEVTIKPPREYEDLPTAAEMPLRGAPTLGKRAQAIFGLGFSSTPEGAANIISKTIPSARFSHDKHGNPLVIVPDEEGNDQAYHLDKPGLNALDVSRFGMKAVPAGAAAVAAGALAPASAVGLPAAALVQGLTGGATSVAEDVISGALGSEEEVDLGKAGMGAAFGAAGPVVGDAFQSFRGLMKPDAFNSLPRGTQNYLKSFYEKFKAGDIPIPQDGRDMILDTAQGRALAQRIIKENPDSEASKMLTGMIAKRDAEAPARVLRDIDSAIGSASASEREAAEAIRQYMKTVSGEETNALNSANPIDPAPIVARIDQMLENAQGKTAAALKRIRSFFVEAEGTSGTSASRTPVTDANGRIIRYETTEAQPGKPPSYKNNPQAIENARTEIDSLINYGDEGLGIKAGELRGRESAIGSIRKDVSRLLKDNVPGYEELMGKFENAYALLKANEVAQNAFRKGAQAIRPDEVKLFLKNPEEAAAFRGSMRSLINERLRGTADDVMSLKSMLGGENDNARAIFEMTFGKRETNRLTRLVERELEYRNTSKLVGPVRGEAQGEEFANAFDKSTRDAISLGVAKDVSNLALQPANVALRSMKGTQGPAYREGLAKFLTAQPEELPAYMRGMKSSMDFEKDLARAQGLTPVAREAVYGSEGRPEERRFGGRTTRATGGAVNLMALSKAAKKQVTQVTEPLLNESDDSVAHALEIANKHI